MTLYVKRSLIVLTIATLVGSNLVALAQGRVRLQAQLTSATDPQAKGQAKFEQVGTRRKFSIQVEGLTPGDVFDAMVKGVVVGKITIDGFGLGSLNFDDAPQANASPFPANFPALTGGELVQVGPLSGTLQAK